MWSGCNAPLVFILLPLLLAPLIPLVLPGFGLYDSFYSAYRKRHTRLAHSEDTQIHDAVERANRHRPFTTENRRGVLRWTATVVFVIVLLRLLSWGRWFLFALRVQDAQVWSNVVGPLTETLLVALGVVVILPPLSLRIIAFIRRRFLSSRAGKIERVLGAKSPEYDVERRLANVYESAAIAMGRPRTRTLHVIDSGAVNAAIWVDAHGVPKLAFSRGMLELFDDRFLVVVMVNLLSRLPYLPVLTAMWEPSTKGRFLADARDADVRTVQALRDPDAMLASLRELSRSSTGSEMPVNSRQISSSHFFTWPFGRQKEQGLLYRRDQFLRRVLEIR